MVPGEKRLSDACMQIEYPILDAMAAASARIRAMLPTCLSATEDKESPSLAAAAELERSGTGKDPSTQHAIVASGATSDAV